MVSLEEAATSAAGGASAVRGRLRVNVNPIFSRLILGPRLQAFMESHPDLELELITRDTPGDLVAEGFDLAVRFGEPAPSSAIARKLLETRVITVAAPSYLKRRGTSARRKTWPARHTCIEFRDPETGKPYPWEFHNKRRRVTVATRGG